MDAEPEPGVALILEVQEVGWNGGDLSALDELVADDYVRHAAGRDQTRAELKSTISAVRKAFPDHRSVIDDAFAAGDRVASRWTSTGTHSDEFLGVPPTGRVVTTSGITISRIDGGRVVEEWAAWDIADLLRGLGVSRIPIDDTDDA